MSVIDDVKQKTDIAEVIGQYVTLIKSGRQLKALCPFHSENTPSFFVYPERQSWHCFGACASGGDVISFVMRKEGLDFGDALRLLAERTGITIPDKFQNTRRDERERLYQANIAATQYYHNLLLNSPMAQKAKEYVLKRGLTVDTLADFQLGFSPNSWESLKQHLMERNFKEEELLSAGLIIKGESGNTHDRFRGRLMFPIWEISGRVTGFGARALDDSQPKYLNSPQTLVFDKSGGLYGINMAKEAIRQQDLTVIVEGYMDVIAAHQHYFKNVVASMGTSITEKQLSILKKLSRNVTLALDSDTAGKEAMLRCVDYENYLETEVKVIILPEGKDPDDVLKEDRDIWQQLIDKAQPLIDFTIDRASAQLDLSTARGKTTLTDNILPILIKVKDNIRSEHYVNRISTLTKTDVRTLEAAMVRLKSVSVPRLLQKVAPSSKKVLSREEYFLTLILQNPELKVLCQEMLPAYLKNSENREIFITWQNVKDVSELKDKLDAAIIEHLDYLLSRKIPDANKDKKCADCILGLQEIYLRDMERQRMETYASETETSGHAAGLAKLEEQGIQEQDKLLAIFKRRSKGASPSREVKND
ncbi:DNA primase [Chloroflexota bacterium]